MLQNHLNYYISLKLAAKFKFFNCCFRLEYNFNYVFYNSATHFSDTNKVLLLDLYYLWHSAINSKSLHIPTCSLH